MNTKKIALISSLLIGVTLLSLGWAEAARPPTLGGKDFVVQTYNYKKGFLFTVGDAYGNVTNYEYGLRTNKLDANGNVLLQFNYDDSGGLKSIVDQYGTVTNYEGGRTTDVGYWVDAAGVRLQAYAAGAGFIQTAEYVYGTDGILDEVQNLRLNDAEVREVYSATAYVDGKPTEEILKVTDIGLGLASGTTLRVWEYEGGLLKSVDTTTKASGTGKDGRDEYQTTYFEGGKEYKVANYQGEDIVTYYYNGAALSYTYSTEKNQTTSFNAKGQRKFVLDGEVDPDTIENWENKTVAQLLAQGVYVLSEYVYNAATGSGGDDQGGSLDYRNDYSWNADGSGYYCYETEYYEFNESGQTIGHEYEPPAEPPAE